MNLTHIIAKRPTKTVYRDGDLGIKVFDESYSASDILNEALNLAIVHESGFPAPAFLDIDRIDGKWAIVYEYVEGDPLARHMAENPSLEDEYFERFVDIQIGMHSCAAPKLRHHTDKMHAKISQSGLDATARYELHTRLDSLPRHSKLCQGDFTPGNVILTPGGKPVVIDWAHATQGNASADAARTYLRFRLAGNDSQAEKYLGLFCKKSDTARQYVQKWLAIVAASQLVKRIPEERALLESWANVVEYE
ncbi:MAG: aminoglycoside phosphotransferase family protein [Clostridiales bacterium]|jgi:aminoglycoside phosphotransferase (APT) family kinase protein|nr:aminoglycoside phosphotransferase family protein [Clostridiales bacterium]